MSDSSSVALRFEGVGKRFDTLWAVKDLTVEVVRGEVFTLLGPSGCGKSTTLRMVAGLEMPDEGKIWSGDRLIADAAAQRFTPPDKRNMGMVFQSYAIWPHITVFDNVAFPLRLRHENKASIRRKVMDTLELVGLPEVAESYPWQLSGGMQQRVALARALVYEPDVLLLDEPLSNLDAKLREQMRDELQDLQRRIGTTFLFVTHDQAEAMVLSTRIAVMNEGRVEQIGTPTEVYKTPATPFVRDFLGQSIVLSGVVRTDGGTRWIDLEIGARIKAPQDGVSLKEGGAVSVACRAESMRLEPATEAVPADRALGVVDHARYLGNRVDYVVRCGEHQITVPALPGVSFPIGASVCLCFAEEGTTVWPDDR